MRIGVLGGGQLGRMLGLAAHAMGIQPRFLDPNPACPAGQVGELLCAGFDDGGALRALGDGADAVTVEFENVPAAAAELLACRVPFFPGARALAVAQDRLAEKSLFTELGVGTPRFSAVGSREELDREAERVGFPAIVKTRRLGYDGKGQFVLRTPGDVDAAWSSLGRASHPSQPASGSGLIIESFVPFRRELSVISVWGKNGASDCYPLIENHHEAGILRFSRAPAPGLDTDLQKRAEAIASRVARALGYVGVLTVELFQMPDGSLLANEMACRVHNSGHWTIEGAGCSQFENHLRAGLDLPLGSALSVAESAMFNLIGTAPDAAAVRRLLSIPRASLHLYGKAPRPGRKLGHVTLCAESRDELQKRIADANEAIGVVLPSTQADQRNR